MTCMPEGEMLMKTRLRTVGMMLGGITALAYATEAAAQTPAPEPAPEPTPPSDPAPPADPVPVEPAPADPAPAPLPAPAEPAPAAEAVPLEAAVEPAFPAEAGAAEGGDLDEVIVTVDRRAKNLQDYSGVASAFSEKRLTTLGISNVRELSAMVPGLQIGTQEGNTEVYIRGIGSDNNTELGDPAVALHIDGVYIPRPRGIGSMFFDIERVEVNSGPQGTLRGRNAMGGSVNIVTAQPKLGEFGANAEATFGNYALRRYTGMVNIPVGDAVAFRFAGFSEVHDPYYENAGPIHDIVPSENADAYALRGTFRYQPTVRFNATLAYDLTAERGTGYLGSNFQDALTRMDDNGTPDDPDDDVPDPVDIHGLDNPRRTYLRGMQPSVDMKHQGGRVNLTYDAGPVIVEGLGSYRALKYQQITGSNAGLVFPGRDLSDVNTDNFSQNQWDSRSKSFIAELRLYAPDTARFRWTIGGFYFNEVQDVVLGQTTDPGVGYGGGEFNMPGVEGGSFAGYADGTFDVVESFRVLGGIRVTRETKTRNGGLWGIWVNLDRDAMTDPLQAGDPVAGLGRFGTEGFLYRGLNRPTYEPESYSREDRVNFFLDGIESFGARDEVALNLCNDPLPADDPADQTRLIVNDDGNFRCRNGIRDSVPDNIFSIVPQNNEVKNTYVDWRAGVEFDASADSLLYATVTTGHKAAGFNDTQDVGGPDLFNLDYDLESMISFELGSKNTFLERALRLNASAFVYRYSNMQFQTVVSVGEDPPGDEDPPSSAVRQNAKEAAMAYGLDLDVVYRLPAGLEAEVHALFMDSSFGDGTIVNDARIGFGPDDNYLADIGGNKLPRSSAMTLNYALSQLIFTEAGSFNWMIQGQTRTTHYMTVFNGNGERLSEPAPGVELTDTAEALADDPRRLNDEVPTYTRFDVGAGWTHPDGRLSINGFVNNLTDIAYITSLNTNPGLNLRFFNPPRTAGVRVRVDW